MIEILVTFTDKPGKYPIVFSNGEYKLSDKRVGYTNPATSFVPEKGLGTVLGLINIIMQKPNLKSIILNNT